MDTQSLRKSFFRENGILAWMVCIGMLLSNIIVQGINNCFGGVISTIIVEFQSNLASVSLIPSIHSAAYYFAGFICSILVRWYSFRTLLFIGGVGSTLAFVASFFASSINSLILWYGLFGGMGNGLVYVPGLIACGFYFDESKRALATGIATSGSGIGIVAVPLFVNYVNENFGWRHCMLVLCFISPIICLVALIMLPLAKPSNDEPQVAPEKPTILENGENTKSDPKKLQPVKQKRSSICDMKFVGFDIWQVMGQFKQYLLHSWNLMRQPKLITYCVSHGLFTLAYFIPVNFLSAMMVESKEIGVDEAGFIIPIVGLATCAGKLFTGLLISQINLNALGLHTFYLVACGICCLIFTFCSQYSHFVTVAVFYGLVVGPIDMLIMECLSKMFGMELVKDTVGFVMLVYAIGAGIGAPIGGLIYDVTENFDGVFYFSAAIYIVGAIFALFSLIFSRKLEKIRSEYLPI